MATYRLWFLLAFGLFTAGSVAAPVGTGFTYQGELKVSGVAANSAHDFEFALFNVDVAGAAISTLTRGDLAVNAGLFTVELDYTDVPFVAAEQYWLEVRVRDGGSVGGYTPLLPRQKLTPAPYAVNARTVQAGGVTQGAIAVGAVGNAQLQNGAVATPQITDLAVTNVKIANATITDAKIANATITAAKLAFTPGDVTGVAAGSGLTGGGTAGDLVLAVDTTAIQARITGSCGNGEYFRGINADGSLDCELLPVAFDRVLDLVGEFGSHVALALRADQRPLVAYHDVTNGNLKLYDCADASCASGTRRLLDSAGDVGENIALAIGPGGLPVIAYRSVTAQSLKFYECANAACSSGTARTLDDVVDVGAAVGMGLRADGRPVIAYYDLSNFRLRVYDCNNGGCSSGAAHAHPGTGPLYGASVAMRADGRALFAMGGNAGAGTTVRVYDCSDTGCTTGTSRSLTDLNYSTPVSLVIRGNGRPLVATAGIGSGLAVHDCADAVCIGGTRTNFDSGTTNAVGMALRGDGRALVVFGASSGATDLRVFDCGNAGCSAGSSRSLVAGGNFGTYAALALRDDGRPVIAHFDAANDDLRLHICANPDCS